MSERPPFMPCLGLRPWVIRSPEGVRAGVCSANQVEWYRAQGCEVGPS